MAWAFVSHLDHDRLLMNRIIEEVPEDQPVVHFHECDIPSVTDYSLVVVWSGGLSWKTACACHEHHIPVCYCEHGLLSGMIQMDPVGVNLGNSVGQLPVDQLRGMLMRMIIDPGLESRLLSEPFFQRKIAPGVKVNLDDTDDGKTLPERYTFFPMQVHDDANLVQNGDGWTNEAAILGILKTLPPNRSLVVKEHPSDAGRKDYTAFREEYLRGEPVQWRRSTSADKLIASAERVVTVNSSLGVEAMRRRKATRVLGKAVFAPFANEGNSDLCFRFVYYMRWKYLIHTNQFALDIEGNRQAVKRLRDIEAGTYPWLSDDVL